MNVIIDTGPIVAMLDKRDQYHRWVKEITAALSHPFYTCEAVLTESFYLLQPTTTGHDQLLRLLERELIQITFSYNQPNVHRIINTYPNLPASFADACLVAMAETQKESTIFTLDNDFHIYRSESGDSLSLITP